MSKYERYKKDVIEPRQAKRGELLSSREIRRKLGRKNMKPKTIQQKEISNIIKGNKALIQSLKKQLILHDQKINAIQHDVEDLRETLATFETPTDGDLGEKYQAETGKKSLWRGNETKAFQQWKGKKK